MKKIVILFINITCYYFGIFAQCPTSSFTVNPVCGNDSVVINTTTPAGYTHYSWDYCSGELGLDSIVRTSLSPFSSSFSVSSSKLVTDGQDWFLFALTNNILYRLDFGHSLDNVPTVQNLGTPGGANSPYSIDFVLENNNWYALVTYNASIRLLNFGNALVNTPSTSAITLPTGTLASPRGLTLARDNDTLVALIVGNTNNRIRLLRFGTSILNPITAADTLSIPHDVGTGASNIALAKECNSWYALVNATASGRINRINLGSKLFDTNSSVDSLLTGPSNSSELVLVREGGRFKAFFNTFTSTTVRLNYLDFGASMLNTPAYTSKNFTGVGTGTSGLSLAVNQSKWTAFLISQSLNSLVTKLNFYEPCQAQPMTFSGQIPLSPVYQTIGNFKIAQTVDSLGVTSATAQPVSFSPKPIANFTLNNVCKGETTIFTNTSTSGLPITNLLWNFGGNDTVSNQNSVQRIFSGFGTYPSSLTVINSAGCASAITKQAKVFDKPIAGFYNNVICAGEMLDITDTSTVAIDTINHWFWTIEGQSFSQQNPSMVTALGGNVVSTLIVETNMGCKDTLTKSLMVKPSPDIDVLITDACFGNTTTFGNNTTVLSPAIMSTYEWSFGDNTGSTLVSPVKQYNNPGVYPITLIATADNNCSDTLNTLLTIGNPPATNFDVVGTCQNSNIQFVDLSVGTDSVVLWNWNFGDGTFSTLKNPNKVYASPGSFVVTLCAGVGPGCDSCISKVVNVSAMPIANFSADTVCFGQPTAFQNLSSVALPQNIVSYKWYLGNGDSASIATPSYVYPNAGGYTCTLDVVSDSGCISSFSKSVFIYSNPIANFTVNPECVGNQVAFTNTSLSFNGAVNKWNWNFGDGTFDSVPNPTHTFSSAAVYNVKLNVESEFGCSDSIQKNAGPVFVSIIASDTACVSASVNLSATSNGLTNYEWDYCSGELGLDSIVRTSLSPFSSGFSVSSSKLVTDGQDWFLFALTNNILYRLDFGHSLDNVPTVQNLGTPGGANSPYSIDFVLENNNWYALVTYNASIRLLNFGNALVNTPSTSAITLPTGTLASPRGLTLARDNDTLVALIVGNTNNRIRLLRFGTSILNPITAADTLSIPHDVGTGASNIALAKDCNSWYALVNATASGRINRINLGSKLFDTNSSVDSLLTGPSNSSELVLVREGGRFKAFFNTFTSTTVRLNYLDFGASMLNTPAYTSKNFTGVGTGTSGLSLAVNQSKWTAFLISQSLNSLVTKLNFYEPCQAQPMVSNSPSSLVKYLSSGSFQASVVGSDVTIGAKSIAKSITINHGPIANFGYEQACEGQTTLFFDSTVVIGTTLNTTYWTLGNGNNSFATNPTTNYANAGTYTVRLIQQAVNGCSDTATKQIVVSDIPVANFSSQVTCQNDSAVFIDLSTSNDSILSWQWNFGDLLYSTISNPIVFIDTAGTISATLIISNLGGCKDTLTQTISLNPKPDFDIVVENTCVGDNVNFINNSTVKLGGQILTSRWDFGDGVSVNTYQANHTYLPDTANFNVVYSAETNAGCTDSVLLPIRISTPPSPNFVAGTACVGTATSFTDLSLGTSDTVFRWVWDFGNGDTSFIQHPSQVYAASGNYMVKLIAISPTFCDSAITKTITVLPSPIVVFGADSVCGERVTTFTNNSTVASPNVIQSWLWNFGDGNNSNQQNPTHAYSQAGLYTASLQATSDSGCTSTNSLVVFVKYQPDANFTPSGITCAQSATQFFNQSTVSFPGIISSYAWDFGDNTIDTATNPIHVYTNQNFYPVKLIVISNDGCSDTTQQNIEVFAPFSVDFEFANICLGDTVAFSDITNSFSIINRQWNFGDGSFFVSDQNPKHKFNTADTYLVTLQAENAIGCIDTASKSVVIIEKPKADFVHLIGCEDAPYSPLDNSTSAETIINRLWLINGNYYSTNAPQFAFADTGNFPLQLAVTTQSGCVDSITKTISIKPRPIAAFGFTPLYGEAPVEITTVNQSTDASTYEWSFGDGDFSADENPKHIYTQNGSYNIQLKAISAFGCEDSTVLTYLVVPTDLDIAVTEITANQNVLPDGNIAVSITAKVSNLGTRQITNYTLYANVGSGGVITETWNGLLSSGQTMLYTFTAKFILSSEKAQTYVCVKATDVNNGETELALFNNQQCTPLTEMWQVAGPTPNPTNGASSVNIILPKAGKVTLSIIDLLGRVVWPAQELSLPAGRTDYVLPIQQLLGAEYFVQLTYNDEKIVRKLFVRK